MDLTPKMLSLISGALALIPIEKYLEGGWIGVNANLELNAILCALNAEANVNLATHLVQSTSVAEFPVKGSGLTPLDSPRYRLRCYMKLLWLSTSEAHTNNQAYTRYSNMKYARHNTSKKIWYGNMNYAQHKQIWYDVMNDALHN